MSWTDERIDRLTQMWGEGMSASQIATQLGGVTRNAVIGKVHRLKLDNRLKSVTAVGDGIVAMPPAGTAEPATAAVPPAMAAPAAAEERPAPRLVASTPAPRPVPVAPTLGATALKFEPAPEPEFEPDFAESDTTVVPMSRNLTLVQLSDRTCKWPLGDPLSSEFRFCGNHSGDASPYCTHHARIAFQPVSERRRVR